MVSMTIIKPSRSGKGLIVIDDQGNVFGTSWEWIRGLFEGRGSGFVLLSRYPGMVSPSRFGQSPLYNPGNKPVDTVAPEGQGSDALGELQKLQRAGQDRVVVDIDEW